MKITAIFLALFVCSTVALRVCHHNDFQARYIEVDENNRFCTPKEAAAQKCFSSAARLKTAMDTLKCEIRISAGDFSFGTIFWTVFDEKIAIAAYNALKYDIAIFGIEDVTIGLGPIFKTIAQTPSISWLGTNINFPAPPQGVFLDKVLNKGGVCWVSALTTLLTDLYNYDGIRISDPAMSIRQNLNKCGQRQNVVAVTHLGLQNDVDLCKKVPELDLVIGGFTQNDLAKDGSYPRRVVRGDGSVCYVVTAFAFGRQLGFLDLDFKNGRLSFDGYGVLPLDSKIPRNKKVDRIIGRFASKLNTRTSSKKIATLTGVLKEDCAGKECASGNLICDALLDAAEDAVACVVNSDFSRGTFGPGPVLKSDLLDLVPFPNNKSIITLSGQGILDALENGLAAAVNDPIGFGPFLQVAGMKVVFDRTRQPGRRVVNVAIGNHPLIKSFKYKIVTSSFLALKNYGFNWERASNIDISHVPIRNIVEFYLRFQSPYKPVVEGRLKRLQDMRHPGRKG